MPHTFNVRTPDGRITELTVHASTRALAAAWIDKSEYAIVHVFGRR